MTLTINPIECLQYGGYGSLVLGSLSAAYWVPQLIRANRTNSLLPSKATTAGWLMLVLMAVGFLSFPARYNLQGRAYHKTAFAQLPVEWQNFYGGLNEVDNNELRELAIKKFCGGSTSPKISIDDYNALTGAKLWRDSRSAAMKSLERSRRLRELVDLDFTKGKN